MNSDTDLKFNIKELLTYISIATSPEELYELSSAFKKKIWSLHNIMKIVFQ